MMETCLSLGIALYCKRHISTLQIVVRNWMWLGERPQKNEKKISVNKNTQ